MPRPVHPVSPLAPPRREEVAALVSVAAYLHRAGTVAATQLLDHPTADQASLLTALRDQLLAGAALCDGLLDLLGEPS